MLNNSLNEAIYSLFWKWSTQVIEGNSPSVIDVDDAIRCFLKHYDDRSVAESVVYLESFCFMPQSTHQNDHLMNTYTMISDTCMPIRFK